MAAEPEAQNGTSVAELVEGGERRGQGTGVAEQRGGDANPQTDGAGSRRCRGENRHRLAGNALVGDPHLVEVGLLRGDDGLDEPGRGSVRIQPDPEARRAV